MTFTRANPLGWALYEIFLSSECNAMDINISRALDGYAGGTYNPSAELIWNNALTVDSTSAVGTNVIALTTQGKGASPGIASVGGSSNGWGGYGKGGATNGNGWVGEGTGDGVGVAGLGDSVSTAIVAGGYGAGLYGVGYTGKPGTYTQGGSTSGTGCVSFGGAPDGSGILSQGYGNGVGVAGFGDSASTTLDSDGYGAGLYGVGANGSPGTYTQGGNSDGDGLISVGDGNGYGALLLGEGSVDPADAFLNGGGLVSVGSTLLPGPGVAGIGGSAGATGVYGKGGATNGYGASFTGQGSGLGAYLQGGATGAELFLAPRSSDPSGTTAPGGYYSDNDGNLKGHINGEWRYVGCQAWANVSTDGAGGITLESGLGVASATLSLTKIRITFDMAFDSVDDYAAVATSVGSNKYYAETEPGTASYVDIQLYDDTGVGRNATSEALDIHVIICGK